MIQNIQDPYISSGPGKLESLKQRVQHREIQGNKQEKDEKLMEACEGFEALFLQKILESMRDTLPGNALFEESHGMQMYKSMYDQYLAEDLSKSHKLGVSDFLYKELTKKS